jgi:hypothetical protein
VSRESPPGPLDQAATPIRVDDAALGAIKQFVLVSVRKVSESFESVSGYLKKGLESIESPVIRYVSPIREVADVDERGAYPA